MLCSRLALALVVVGSGITLAACGTSGNEAQSPEATTTAESRPGSAVVYQRIESLTDCAALQAEFDQADENNQRESASGDLKMMEVTRSYMEAADARMQEIGCYG